MTDFSIADLYGNEGGEALTERKVPHAYLQWKNTDVCMDFRCPCDEEGGGHFDGYFASIVECPRCHRRWEMGWHVLAREATPETWGYANAKMLDDS